MKKKTETKKKTKKTACIQTSTENEDAQLTGFKNMPHLFFFYRALKKFPGGTPGRTLPVTVLFTGAPALVSKEPVYLPCCSATIFSVSSKKGNAPNIGKALPRCFKVVDILTRLKTTTTIKKNTHTTTKINNRHTHTTRHSSY